MSLKFAVSSALAIAVCSVSTQAQAPVIDDHAEIELTVRCRIQERYTGVVQPLIDVRVMNDFTDQKNSVPPWAR